MEPHRVPEMMSEAHKEILRRHWLTLIDSLTPSIILDKLVSEDVITLDEMDHIKQERVSSRQATTLLQYLVRKEDRAFSVFVEACRKSSMAHLAKLLEGEDTTSVGVTFSVNSPSKRNRRKRRPLTDTNRGLVNQAVKQKLSDPNGELRQDLKNRYGVEYVDIQPDHDHNHHPHHPLMVISFVILGSINRFVDQVMGGDVASLIAGHVKKDGGDPSTQPWELSAKVQASAEEEEDDEAVDLGAQLEADGDDEVDGSSREHSAEYESAEDVLDHASSSGAMGGPRAEGAGACAMEAREDMVHSQPLYYQQTAGTPRSEAAMPTPREQAPKVPYAAASATVAPPQEQRPKVALASGTVPAPKEQQQQRTNNKHPVTQNRTNQNDSHKRNEKVELFEIIKDKKKTDLDFARHLRKLEGTPDPLSGILNDEGFNCAHACLEHNRGSFLVVLQAMGHWVDVTSHPAKGSTQYAGCTPRAYAVQKRYRRLVRQMDSLDNHEKSMGGQNSALKFGRAGDLQGLKNAVNSGDRVRNPKDSEGNTLLHWACVSGNLNLVKYVGNELKVDPRTTNNQMQNALHAAVIYGRSNLVDFLLNSCDLDPREVDGLLKTPAFRAAENGDFDTLRQLHEANVALDQNVTTKAAKNGSVKCMRFLLEEIGMDTGAIDPEGRNLLMLAAENGHLELVTYLVEWHALSLNILSKQKRNALHYAAEKGHTDVTKYLISQARRHTLLTEIINQKDKHKLEQDFSLVRGLDKGKAAWHYICLQRRYISLYEICTKNGKVDASFVGTIVKSGWGDEPEVQVLKQAVLDYKEATGTKDGEEDLTPLMLALVKGHGPVALLLLEAGADPKVTDCFQQTSTHLAAMRGLLTVAVELEKLGVALNAADADGYTPLRVAQGNEHTYVSNFLSDNHLKQVHSFTEKAMERTKEELAAQKLSEVRQTGQDVTRHIVNAVRELQIDINILLRELGSGPVLEETSH